MNETRIELELQIKQVLESDKVNDKHEILVRPDRIKGGLTKNLGK